jgi:hypothetical protein
VLDLLGSRRVGAARTMPVLFLLAAITATSCAEPAREPRPPIKTVEPPREILTPPGEKLPDPRPDRSDRPIVQAAMTADDLAVSVSHPQKGNEGSGLGLDDEMGDAGHRFGPGTLPGESDIVLQPGERTVFIIPHERLPSAPGEYAVILRYESNGTVRTAPPDVVNIGEILTRTFAPMLTASPGHCGQAGHESRPRL